MKILHKIITSNTPTVNGHIYTKKLLENLVEENKNRIIEGRMLGQIGMDSLEDIVDLSKVSHKVTKLSMSGSDLFCEIEILDTHEGNKLLELFPNIVFRFHGIGTVNDDNTIGSDYQLISINAYENNGDANEIILS